MPPVLILSLFALLVAPLAAQETPSPAPRPSRWSLGVGVASIAAYPGSDDRRVLVLPVLSADLGRIYLGGGASGTNGGAGVFLVRQRAVIWTAELGGTLNRRAEWSDDLAGFGDRGFGTTAGTSLAARIGPLQLGLTAAQGLRREVGRHARATLGAQAAIGARLLVAGGVGATWSDRRHMAWDFGVSDTDAAASGQVPFAPRAGLRDLHATVAPVLRLSSRLSLGGFATVTRLGEAAAESPLARRRTWVEGGIALVRAM